jgi:hypothetical protein
MYSNYLTQHHSVDIPANSLVQTGLLEEITAQRKRRSSMQHGALVVNALCKHPVAISGLAICSMCQERVIHVEGTHAHNCNPTFARWAYGFIRAEAA